MKKIYIIVLMLIGQFTIAQTTTTDIGKIALSVVMPSNTDQIQYKEFEKLKSKIQQMASLNGVSGDGYYSNFVIYPKFEIFEQETVDAGLTPKTYVKGELSLYVSQVNNNLIFNSTFIHISGVGNNREKAILNAISRVNTRDTKLAPFFTEAKAKIIDYYQSNCDLIASKAKALVKKQQYQQAIGLLMSVPEEAQSCYQKIQDETVNAYIAYQNNLCSTTILDAKSQIAKDDYSQALITLSKIDPSSKCYTDAETLVAKIDKQIESDKQQAYNDRQKDIKQRIAERKEIRGNQQQLELARINALKEIASSYYNAQSRKKESQPNSNVYIIK